MVAPTRRDVEGVVPYLFPFTYYFSLANAHLHLSTAGASPPPYGGGIFLTSHSILNTCTKGANFIFAEQKLHVGMPTLHDFALAKLLHCKRTLAFAPLLPFLLF